MKIGKKLLFWAGLIELILGLSHFYMLFDISDRGELNDFSLAYSEFFFYGMLTIGSGLAIFGLISLVCAIKIENYLRIAIMLAFFQGFMWTLRSLAELIFPVKVHFLDIQEPSYHIFSGTLIVGILFLISGIKLYRSVHSAKNN